MTSMKAQALSGLKEIQDEIRKTTDAVPLDGLRLTLLLARVEYVEKCVADIAELKRVRRKGAKA